MAFHWADLLTWRTLANLLDILMVYLLSINYVSAWH